MSKIYLRKISLEDGLRELEFLKSIPEKENGFENPADIEDLMNLEKFKEWVKAKINDSKGINLKEGYVPQTIYWVMEDDNVVGIGKLRHYLNDHLLKHGGNIGYGVALNYRGKGIATKALALLIEEAKQYDQEEVLLTTDENNIGSRKVIENNGGILKKNEEGTCFYWIKLNK